MSRALYTRLPKVESHEGLPQYSPACHQEDTGLRVRWRQLQICLVVSLILNVLFVCMRIGEVSRSTSAVDLYAKVYSPAQSVVEYKIVKFTRGLMNDIPIYEQSPSTAVDEAWESLYNFPGIKIPKSEAVKLPNVTWPLTAAGDAGSYLMILDVFHELHCLDTLRQQLYPERNYTRPPENHLLHCVGVVRQALMCAADTSTIVWQWSEDTQEAEQRDDIPHVCPDFEKIQAWQASHHIEYYPDFTDHLDSKLDIRPF